MSEFTVEGVPQGKGRPRFGNGHTYTPQSTMDYEEKIKLCYLRAKGINYKDAPIFMQIVMYFPIPKGASKHIRQQMLTGGLRPTRKPDFDNCAKVVSDSLNGIAYNDDRQIVDFMCAKYYSDMPRIEVSITPLNQKP